MRLVTKLALLLFAVFLGAFSLAVLRITASVDSRLRQYQDRSIERDLDALARHCAEAQGPRFERICLEALYYKADASRPALYAAYLIDPQFKIALHTDFLKGDYARRGAEIRDSEIRENAAAGAPFVLRREGQRVFGVPVSGKEGRIGSLIAMYNDDELANALNSTPGETRQEIAWAALIALALGSLLAVGLTHVFVSPLSEFERVAERVGKGDLLARVRERHGDELSRLSMQFNRMIAQLAQLDELKSSFVAKVTHDLKTPIQAIEAEADNLLSGLKGPLTDVQKSQLELIIKNGRVLAELIDHLLELTSLESGRAELHKGEVDLESEIGSAISLQLARAEEFGVTLSSQIEPGLAHAYADDSALRRVLTNLIGNALKFTPKGGQVVIRAKRSQPNEVTIAVSDTGIGVPKDRLPSLFKKFSQVPETRNKIREAGGSGLGLVICKELVEAHGGRIWAESALFRGTTIFFTLPEKATTPAAPSTTTR